MVGLARAMWVNSVLREEETRVVGREVLTVRPREVAMAPSLALKGMLTMLTVLFALRSEASL
jgi:hypothetical protein